MRQGQENDTYDVVLKPIKLGNEYFVAFKIMVKNETDKGLQIDWNKTRYIYAGKSGGGFVFKGIDQQMVKNRTVPLDLA